MKPLIYVCSPLRGDTRRNIQKAIGYCRYVYAKGGIPIAPHAIFTQFLDDEILEERAAGINMGMQLLSLCDEVWVFGKKISEGMFTEIERAKALGIKIKRFDDKCNSFEEQAMLFRKLEETRKSSKEEQYHSIPEAAKKIRITPSDYCDYRACRKKASDEILIRVKALCKEWGYGKDES